MADEAAALQAIAGKPEGRKAELAKLDEQQNPPLPLAQVWSQYMGSPNRPDSGEETLYGYECQWTTFAEWLAKRHPEILALRQVTKDVAEEYADARPEGNNGRATRNISENRFSWDSGGSLSGRAKTYSLGWDMQPEIGRLC